MDMNALCSESNAGAQYYEGPFEMRKKQKLWNVEGTYSTETFVSSATMGGGIDCSKRHYESRHTTDAYGLSSGSKVAGTGDPLFLQEMNAKHVNRNSTLSETCTAKNNENQKEGCIEYVESAFLEGWMYVNDRGEMCGPYAREQLSEGLATGFLPNELPVYRILDGGLAEPVPLISLIQSLNHSDMEICSENTCNITPAQAYHVQNVSGSTLALSSETLPSGCWSQKSYTSHTFSHNPVESQEEPLITAGTGYKCIPNVHIEGVGIPNCDPSSMISVQMGEGQFPFLLAECEEESNHLT